MGTLNIAGQCRLLFVCTIRRTLKPGSNRGVGSQFASYHSTGTQHWPKDSGIKPVERRRRSVLSNSGLHQRPVASDGWQGRVQSDRSRDRLEAPAPNKTWKREAAVMWEQKPQGDSRMSSELRKLSFEDFTEEREKPVRERGKKDSKEERNYYEIVFGASPCLLALTQGRRKAHRLFVKEGEASHRASVLTVCEEAHRRGVQIQRVSKKELDRMSAGRVHQGLCLQASPLGFLTEERASMCPRESSKTPLWLVLDGIQDPMNLGAILRSAYFLGVDRVASSLHNSCPLTPVVSKASSGVMEVIGVYGYKSLEDMLKLKVVQGWQVVGTVGAEVADSHTPVTQCSDFLMTKPTLLLMGGEGEGLSPELLRQCETLLTIPTRRDLHPGIESLNVSVATGILLHSLLSSRRAGN